MRYETPVLLPVDNAAALILGGGMFEEDNSTNPPTKLPPGVVLGLD